MDFTTGSLVVVCAALTAFCIARMAQIAIGPHEQDHNTPRQSPSPQPHVARQIVAQLPPITTPTPPPIIRGASMTPRREPTPERWAALADPPTRPHPIIQPLTLRHLAIYTVTIDHFGRN